MASSPATADPVTAALRLSPESFSFEERFALTRELTSRFDSLIASVSERCAVVISADAILIGALVFATDKIKETGISDSRLQAVVVALLLLSFVLLTMSIVFATTGVVTTWGSSSDLLGDPRPDRAVFHTTDTLRRASNFEEFKELFEGAEPAALLNSALGELWTTICINHHRYWRLRRATQCAVLSLPPFAASVVTFAFVA